MYTKQDLATLGKRVSDDFLKQGMPLNESIIKLASTRPDMTNEHIQRVIENANLITFEEMFKGSSSKHIVFDLADPEEIRARLNTQASEKVASVYLTAPESNYDISQWEPEEKVANVVPDHVRWRREYYATKGAVEHLVKEANSASAKAEAMTHNFIHTIKKLAHVNGLKPVLQLAGYASEDKDIFQKVASAASQAMPPLVKEGSFTDTVPNKNHPLYQEYKNLEEQIKVANKLKSALVNAERYHQSIISENYL